MSLYQVLKGSMVSLWCTWYHIYWNSFVGRCFVLCCVACGVYCIVQHTLYLSLHYLHRLLLTLTKRQWLVLKNLLLIFNNLFTFVILFVSENSERDHLGPSSLRHTSVKQVAREKRFCHELFLPLLNAKLTPEIIEFIKDEVTRQLNLKVSDICNIQWQCDWHIHVTSRLHRRSTVLFPSHITQLLS